MNAGGAAGGAPPTIEQLTNAANQIKESMLVHVPDISVDRRGNNHLSIVSGGVAIGGPQGFLDDYTQYDYDPITGTLTLETGPAYDVELYNTLKNTIAQAFAQVGGRRKNSRKSRKVKRNRKTKKSRKGRRNY